MKEMNSDYFFGRERETVDVLSVLAAAPDLMPILIGNSGVGKSSVARAGVLAALKRQAWPEEAHSSEPWPSAFRASRHWCFLTFSLGVEPIKALVESFLETWRFDATDPRRVDHQNGWIARLLDGTATLGDLIDASARTVLEKTGKMRGVLGCGGDAVSSTAGLARAPILVQSLTFQVR